jgi:hypothetical protein
MKSTPTRAASNHVFISYSHKDGKWLDRLLQHVRPLVRVGQIQVFSDKNIIVGADWRREIETALDTASIAVLLISVHFLASDFIMNEELPRLLASAEDRGTKILPVIVTASLYKTMPSLSRFQAANSPDKPLEAMSQSKWNKVLTDLAREIQLQVGS